MSFQATVARLIVELAANNAPLRAGLDEAQATIALQEQAHARLRIGLTAVGAAATAAGAALVGATGYVVKSAVDWETAFTGVRKTAGELTSQELPRLEASLLELSTQIPVSAEALADIAANAGQLGVDGVDNVLKFTRVIADLGATSEDFSGPEAAQQLARFLNIFGEGTQDVDRLGSVITDLGNNTATTEGQIVAMATRLAGAGHEAGMTQAEVLALAAALSSVGIEAEMGGTAVSRVIGEMAKAVAEGNDKLGAFAEVAGMTAEQFSAAWRDSPARAFEQFVQGLSTQGDAIYAVFEAIGLDSLRTRDTLLRLKGAGDLVGQGLDRAAAAWEANNALTSEAEKRYATAASELTKLWNEIQRTAILTGRELIPAIKILVGAVVEVAGAFGDFAQAHPTIAAALLTISAAAGALLVVLGPIVIAAGQLLPLIGGLSGAWAAAAPVVATLGTAMGATGAAATALGVAFVAIAAGSTYMAAKAVAAFVQMRQAQAEAVAAEERTRANEIKQREYRLEKLKSLNAAEVEAEYQKLQQLRQAAEDGLASQDAVNAQYAKYLEIRKRLLQGEGEAAVQTEQAAQQALAAAAEAGGAARVAAAEEAAKRVRFSDLEINEQRQQLAQQALELSSQELDARLEAINTAHAEMASRSEQALVTLADIVSRGGNGVLQQWNLLGTEIAVRWDGTMQQVESRAMAMLARVQQSIADLEAAAGGV